MRVWRLAVQALRAMRTQKMHAGLMMVGLIIGIASVTVIIEIGQGARQEVLERMNELGFGANSFIIQPGIPNFRRRRGPRPTTMKMRDVAAVRQFTFVTHAVPHRRVRGKMFIYRRTATDSRLSGSTPEFTMVRNWGLKAGRFFTPREVRRKARVLVLGTTLARNLFGGTDPLGRFVRVGKVYFRVIGVLEPKGSTPRGHDRDDIGVAPITTVLRRVLNSDYIDMIKVNVRSPDVVPLAVKSVEKVLRRIHKVPPGVPDDFHFHTADELLDRITRQSRAMVMMLALIAAISLFVSGIVIMNIMLVSVSERKQEIGVRRAVGACRRDILIQFVLEAMIVSLAGGISGFALGQAVSRLLTAVLEVPTAPSVTAVVLAISFAAVVGLIFGVVPARRAAQLSPVEAVE